MAEIKGYGFQMPHEAESPGDLVKNVDSCILSPEILNLFGAKAFAFVIGI